MKFGSVDHNPSTVVTFKSRCAIRTERGPRRPDLELCTRGAVTAVRAMRTPFASLAAPTLSLTIFTLLRVAATLAHCTAALVVAVQHTSACSSVRKNAKRKPTARTRRPPDVDWDWEGGQRPEDREILQGARRGRVRRPPHAAYVVCNWKHLVWDIQSGRLHMQTHPSLKTQPPS